MSAFNVINPTSMVTGQPEDVGPVLQNFNAIASILNGHIDATNIDPTATPTVAGLVLTTNSALALRLTGAGAGITFGGDSNLYRTAANTLKTDGGFFAVGQLVAWLGGTAQVSIGDVGGGVGGIYFGSPSDTRIFRSAAQELRTDGGLVANGGAPGTLLGYKYIAASAGSGSLIASYVAAETNPRYYVSTGGVNNWGPGGASGTDTNLYRYGAAQLASDSQFYASRGSTAQIRLGSNSGTPTIWFGNALGDTGDTDLWRYGAGILRTSGKMMMQDLCITDIQTAAGITLPNPAPRRIQLFDSTGASNGFIPVYNNV